MNEIAKKLRQARPKLSVIAPLTVAISWGFVGVNMVLGLGMLLLYKGTIAPISIADILSYPQWGLIFLALGLSMLFALGRNDWRLAKNTQLAGMLVKSVWLIALIFRCFGSPQTILITAVWAFLVYIQAATYIHFLPQLTTWNGEIPEDNDA